MAVASSQDEGVQDASSSYDLKMQQMRPAEFSRFEGSVYVDHAGAALYSEAQLENVMQTLKTRALGNPHSQHAALAQHEETVEAAARRLTLAMCSASPAEYEVVFTSGATAAFKLVADCFPWAAGSRFAYTRDNHTSVVGMREIALAAGAAVCAADLVPGSGGWCVREVAGGFSEPCRLDGTLDGAQDTLDCATPAPESLFAYPLESNFSGARYALEAATNLQRTGRWRVLLDAAKACGTQPPDLSTAAPDFVVLSYYKIFGYPTGLGALLVRRNALGLLRKRYFGGGTVAACSAEADFVRQREGVGAFEDGTVSFLGLAALPAGFAQVRRVGGFSAIAAHTAMLTRRMASQLQRLTHHNGFPVCTLYGQHGASHDGVTLMPPGSVGQGPVVTFNILRADGSYVGYREVERLAALCGILLRTGCFCNPGGCAMHLGLSSRQIEENFEAGHVCWDDNDLVDGCPTGAVRISFGYSSTTKDVAAVLRFVQTYFVQGAESDGVASAARLNERRSSHEGASCAPQEDRGAVLEAIHVYPIKSCAAFSPASWPLGPNGLLLDREWALVDEAGAVLVQKRAPALTRLRPSLNLRAGIMEVSSPSMAQPLIIPLPLHGCDRTPHSNGSIAAKGHSSVGERENGGTGQNLVRVCADNVCTLQVGGLEQGVDEISGWFTIALGIRCRLVQQVIGSRASVKREDLLRGGRRKNGVTNGVSHANGACAAPTTVATIGFANEAQLLLINSSSLQDVNARLAARHSSQAPMERFRPNLVVGGKDLAAYAEDGWTALRIGEAGFQVAGPCARCEVINIDQAGSQSRGAEPLLTLASFRRRHGRINFGVLLQHDAGTLNPKPWHDRVLQVGMPLEVLDSEPLA